MDVQAQLAALTSGTVRELRQSKLRLDSSLAGLVDHAQAVPVPVGGAASGAVYSAVYGMVGSEGGGAMAPPGSTLDTRPGSVRLEDSSSSTAQATLG